MKWQPILAFGSIAQIAAGLKLIDESEDNGVICYTYLSTYLVAVDAETAGPAPVLPTTRGILPPYFTNRSTSAVPLSTFPADRESSIVLQDPDSTVDLLTSSDFAIPTEFTDLFSPTAIISSDVSTTIEVSVSDAVSISGEVSTGKDVPTTNTASTTGEVSTTSSQAEITGEAVIFFVTPDTDNQRRRLVKRVTPGGFVNRANPVDICTDADTFQLTDEQLLDNGSPVYYNGEPYKQFASDGAPPDGAITRQFAAVNGRLVFASRSLPNTNAGFCQDDTGQVYITFGSSPPGCDPIILQVYTVEQCLNGEIPGPGQASSISSELTQPPATESTDISNLSISTGSQEPVSTVLAEPTGVSPSTDTAISVTQTHSTVIAEEEEETATTDSSSTDLPSQPSLFTSSLSLTSSEISTTASQSAPLLPTSLSTGSTIATLSTDISSYSESSLLESASSIILSTDSTATEPLTEETTSSISTTTLAEESETSSLPTSSAQLETTTTAEATTGTETTTTDTTTAEDETTAEENTTTAEGALATETTTTAEETTAEETTATETTATETTATETTATETTATETTATETTATAEETTATETTTAEEDTTANETATTAEETTATDTTAIAEDTTTTAEETIPTTATTTTGCDSVMVLSTVALLNPTPVFGGSENHDDDIAGVVLPFNVANSGQSTVYVSVNGLIAVGSDTVIYSYENVELPTARLPPIAVCPYWDDLSLIRENGDSIVYEVFNGQHGMQATFEWIVTSSNAATLLHFSATFYKDFPQVTRLSYYSTDGGVGATTGAQNRDTGDFRQISFNEPDRVVDGTAVFFNFDTGYGDTVSFDNTECGKGDPFDRSSAFNNGG